MKLHCENIDWKQTQLCFGQKIWKYSGNILYYIKNIVCFQLIFPSVVKTSNSRQKLAADPGCFQKAPAKIFN